MPGPPDPQTGLEQFQFAITLAVNGSNITATRSGTTYSFPSASVATRQISVLLLLVLGTRCFQA